MSVQKIWWERPAMNINVNFPCKRPILSMNYFEHVFQEVWTQLRNIYCREHMSYRQSFLNKITAGCSWNFFFSKFA